MTLKAVILDLDGTTIQPDGSAVPGIAEAIERIASAGVSIAVATNHSSARAKKLLHANDLTVDVISAPDIAGDRKPSPLICTYVADQLGIAVNEMIYVGDNDKTDALAAMNARVLYLSALWANNVAKYGLHVADPNNLVRFVYRFMLAPPTWYWTLDRSDVLGRRVSVRLLLPATRSSHGLKDVLKFGNNPILGKVHLRDFLFRRMLTSIYMDGIASNLKLWTWYPSSAGQAKHERFSAFLDQASKIFRGSYAPDLLIRHRPAVKLAFARYRGEDPGFANQVSTVILNSDYRKKIDGHEILVIDDFCTEGYSFECGRNLLYAAGASAVHCVGFGRYHDGYQIQTPAFEGTWNPFKIREFEASDFDSEMVYGERDDTAFGEMQRLVQLAV
jgi:HAD superfamily hydrolase (TIGR01662 family)